MSGQELQVNVEDSVRQVQAEPSIGFTVTAAKDLSITSTDDLALAADLAGQLKSELDRIETQRTELVKPLNGVVKTLNAAAKAAAAPLVEADRTLREEMRRYHDASQAQEATERAARQEETGDQVVDPDSFAAAAAKTTKGETATVTFRETWVHEVDDAIMAAAWLTKQDDATLRSLVSIDGTVMRELIKAMGDQAGELQIPGVRIYKRSTPTVRS